MLKDSPHSRPDFNTAYENVPGAFSIERVSISESIFNLLYPVMNEVHGTGFSYRFWNIVLHDYVNAAVSIKHILQKEETAPVPSLLPLNSHHVPTLKQKFMARLPSVIKHYKSPGTLGKIHALMARHDNLSIGIPDFEGVQQETGAPLPLYYPVYFGVGDRQKRKRANALADKMTDIYSRNIIKALPKVFIEYFDHDFSSIKLYDPARKVFHVHGIPPLFNSLFLAKYIEHGAKLFCYQHGAYYGEFVGHNSYLYESAIADEYRTWGWRLQPKDVPWKAYRLEKFKRLYDGVAKTAEFDFLMCFPYIYEVNNNFYSTGTNYFLQHIDKSRYKNLLARPRPINRIFSHAGQIAFVKDSRVTIDSGLGSMAEVMRKCRLIIQFTVPATNFMECLYVDHPTMGLLDNDQPTEIVKPYYDFFMQQGVLHTDFISLVDHLNTIDVDAWWHALIRQPMYQQFKHEFLRKV